MKTENLKLILDFLKGLDLTIFWTLLSVSLGAAISPWVSARIETRRIKRGLKPSFIKAFNSLHHNNKKRIQTLSHDSFHKKIANTVSNRLANEELQENKRKELKRQSAVLDTQIFKLNEDINFFAQKVIESDSEMLNILMQIQSHFGNKKYLELRNIITDYSSKYSKNPDFVNMDEPNLPAEEYNRTLEHFFKTCDMDFHNTLEIIFKFEL